MEAGGSPLESQAHSRRYLYQVIQHELCPAQVEGLLELLGGREVW